MNNVSPVIEAQHLQKTFNDGASLITVLADIHLTINAGEKIAIMGSSGSGKSTLMHLLGGLDQPTQGEVRIVGQPIAKMNQNDLSHLRNQKLGFVYQFHHLLPEFSALENVALPVVLGGGTVEQGYARANELLKQVELGHRLEHRPAQLSGGERQRVAIARALANHPVCVLADEPTGNLDRHTAEHIHQLIDKLNQELNISFLVVTHDQSWADKMQRILYLRDGQLVV
jgi:lipoprotein-releasing system ATP-binding protein